MADPQISTTPEELKKLAEAVGQAGWEDEGSRGSINGAGTEFKVMVKTLPDPNNSNVLIKAYYEFGTGVKNKGQIGASDAYGVRAFDKSGTQIGDYGFSNDGSITNPMVPDGKNGWKDAEVKPTNAPAPSQGGPGRGGAPKEGHETDLQKAVRIANSPGARKAMAEDIKAQEGAERAKHTAEIKDLQKALGFDAAHQTGKFDPATKEAVIDLIAQGQATQTYADQMKAHANLKVDGVYGSNTQAGLEQLVRDGKISQEKAHAIEKLHVLTHGKEDVEEGRRWLVAAGYNNADAKAAIEKTGKIQADEKNKPPVAAIDPAILKANRDAQLHNIEHIVDNSSLLPLPAKLVIPDIEHIKLPPAPAGRNYMGDLKANYAFQVKDDPRKSFEVTKEGGALVEHVSHEKTDSGEPVTIVKAGQVMDRMVTLKDGTQQATHYVKQKDGYAAQETLVLDRTGALTQAWVLNSSTHQMDHFNVNPNGTGTYVAPLPQQLNPLLTAYAADRLPSVDQPLTAEFAGTKIKGNTTNKNGVIETTGTISMPGSGDMKFKEHIDSKNHAKDNWLVVEHTASGQEVKIKGQGAMPSSNVDIAKQLAAEAKKHNVSLTASGVVAAQQEGRTPASGWHKFGAPH